MAERRPLVIVGNDVQELPAGDTVPGVDTIVAGSGIAVDATDPANPIVSATGGSTANLPAVMARISLGF
jgi:hypothetical protein